jgi:hypothetical protein
MLIEGTVSFKVVKEYKRFVKFNHERAIGFGIRIGDHGFVVGWDKQLNRPSASYHKYAWYE